MNIRRISIGLALRCVWPGRHWRSSRNKAPSPELADLEGNVLVSQGDAMVAGTTANQRVPVGTRVVTTSGAKVTISYDVGCDVRLKENERFTVSIGPLRRVAGGGRAARTGGRRDRRWWSGRRCSGRFRGGGGRPLFWVLSVEWPARTMVFKENNNVSPN